MHVDQDFDPVRPGGGQDGVELAQAACDDLAESLLRRVILVAAPAELEADQIRVPDLVQLPEGGRRKVAARHDAAEFRLLLDRQLLFEPVLRNDRSREQDDFQIVDADFSGAALKADAEVHAFGGVRNPGENGEFPPVVTADHLLLVGMVFPAVVVGDAEHELRPEI